MILLKWITTCLIGIFLSFLFVTYLIDTPKLKLPFMVCLTFSSIIFCVLEYKNEKDDNPHNYFN